MTADATSTSSDQTPPGPDATAEAFLNYGLTPEHLQSALGRSELSVMYIPRKTSRHVDDPLNDNEAIAKRQKEEHDRAKEAMSRIVSLANSSSKHKLKANVARCVETFGRHKTDLHLKPRPASPSLESEASDSVKTDPRIGPDTGSSEVQIAILTAKIRTLANFLETRGRTDKVNKRNLRLLVHRRQKLMRYLRKKERGGERWQHLCATLGLTDAMWQGEISM